MHNLIHAEFSLTFDLVYAGLSLTFECLSLVINMSFINSATSLTVLSVT